MKCPECGSQNFTGAQTCRSCGKQLKASLVSKASAELDARAEKILVRQSAPRGKIDPREVAQKLRMDYAVMHREPTAKTIEGLCGIVEHLHKAPIDIRGMMEEAAALIQKLFAIREVAIGLKSMPDGIYRYEVLIGFRPDAEAATKRIQYTESDFWDDKKYKYTSISKLTRVFLSEDNPYTNNEKDSYSRPFMLESKRSALDESIEGDYIDVIMPGPTGEALGWIEISGTRSGKLPDAMALRWIEAVATILGTALVCNDIRRVMARESLRKST